jgi:hypothetical protein
MRSIRQDLRYMVIGPSGAQPMAFAEVIRCATKLKTAIDDMKMARL